MSRKYVFPLLLQCLLHSLFQTATLANTCRDPRTIPKAIVASRKCLPRFHMNISDYSICKTKICYLFLRDSPFIIIPSSFFNRSASTSNLQRPFLCGQPRTLDPGLSGISFRIHNKTSSGNELCVWAGPEQDCSFNALIDLADLMGDEGYQFGVTGMLLQTPNRECRNFPSAPLISGVMTILGRITSSSDNGNTPKSAFSRLTAPFEVSTWVLFAIMFLVFVIFGFLIARLFPSFHENWLGTFLALFVGNPGNAPSKSVGIMRYLFRIAVIATVVIFFLFYEAAMVGHLFRQQNHALSKRVRSLSVSELKSYTVQVNSALELVWNMLVNEGDAKFDSSDLQNPPWQHCDSASHCIEKLKDHSAKYTFTLRTIAKYHMKQGNNCAELAEYETRDVLFHFGGGILYNRQVNQTRRKMIDSELTRLRIAGTVRDIIDDEVGDRPCAEPEHPQIGTFIAFLPIFIWVLLPLSVVAFQLITKSVHEWLQRQIRAVTLLGFEK